MPYTAITKPTQGDATRKALADALIDNDAYFNSVISALNWLQVPNGSFEIDSDADGEPDLWDIQLFQNGAFALTGNLLGDTECRHGARAIKFTSPGGASNGGGTAESTDYNECAPDRPVFVSWLHRSSVATIRNKVDVLFYDANRALLSTVNVYTSITNPTTWTFQIGAATPPSTARFCRIKLTGAENTTTVAGSAYFDGVQLRAPDRKIELTTPGTHKWKCHAGVVGIYAVVLGAGGGGGDETNASAGGGSGGEARGAMSVTAGTTYTIVIGAGGAAGSNSAGAAGGSTNFNGFTAGGGGGGATLGGAGGAGGTASGGATNTPGTAGSARVSLGIGGDGGQSPWSNAAGAGGGGGIAATAGGSYGAGGGGSAGSTSDAGAGAPGAVIIWF